MTINVNNADQPTSIISHRDTELKNVEVFKYLGAHLQQLKPSTDDTELNFRIQMANAKFAELSNLLQSFRINLRTRISFLNSFVRSRLTYACQNWNLTSYQYERLDISYRTFLRRMVSGGFRHVDVSDNDYRYSLSNAQLHSICGTKDVSVFIKSQQKNYVIRMPCERSTKILMFNDDKNVKRGRVENVSIDNFCSLALSKVWEIDLESFSRVLR